MLSARMEPEEALHFRVCAEMLSARMEPELLLRSMLSASAEPSSVLPECAEIRMLLGAVRQP